jgi:hypothetical protein
MVNTDIVQRFVAAIATTELQPLSSEPQNSRLYSYGGILPGSADPAVLELPRGVHWLNDTSATASPPRLYVRPAYQVLLLLAMAFVDHPEVPHHRVVITGSSGTGKTSFLSWVLRHLRRLEKPPVVVLDVAGFFGRVSSDGAVTAGTRGASFRQELALRSTVYLCDATWSECVGPEIRARTVVVSPPIHAVTVKDPADTMRTLVLVMPLWTMAELETCRSTCYSSVSQEALLELFQLWGGVVRWTLGTPIEEAKREFTRCFESLPFASVVQIVRNGGLVGDDKNDGDVDITIGSRLVHMHVDSDSTFQPTGAALCSSAACSILLGCGSKQLQSARDFIERRDGLAAPGAMQLFCQQVQQELFDRESATP